MQIMNRIDTLFSSKRNDILSIFFTAGYPTLNSTLEIIEQLQSSGADIVEVGMPFSDPMADGPTIQHSSMVALESGMTIESLFTQLRAMRKSVSIPVLLMGYFNPVLKFGVENFLKKCRECGIDGVIIPDMPLAIFEAQYATSFAEYGVYNILLATPEATPERIELLAKRSQGFLYIVSSGATTGGDIKSKPVDQLKAAATAAGKNCPVLVGFGVSNHHDFEAAAQYGRGAVVGSAFVKMLGQSKNLAIDIKSFVTSITG